MNVRMILERAAPGMEDAEEATPGRADVLGVGGQGFDRGAGRLEQCGIGDFIAPWTIERAIGSVAELACSWPRPVAGKSQTGCRWVAQ